MKESLLIERATEEDLAVVQQFGFELLEFERRNFDASLDPKWPFSEVGKQKYLEAIKDKYTSIAKIDGRPVGFLIGKIIEMPAESARKVKQARIENIFVDESVRSLGAGRELVEDFKKFCKDNKVGRLDVSVLAENEVAVKFYEKVGFAPRSLNLSQELK